MAEEASQLDAATRLAPEGRGFVERGRLGGLLAFDVGDGGEEAFGVVVLWSEEDFVSFAVFYDFSGVHDGDVVGDVADDGEIVRDEDHGEI